MKPLASGSRCQMNVNSDSQTFFRFDFGPTQERNFRVLCREEYRVLPVVVVLTGVSRTVSSVCVIVIRHYLWAHVQPSVSRPCSRVITPDGAGSEKPRQIKFRVHFKNNLCWPKCLTDSDSRNNNKTEYKLWNINTYRGQPRCPRTHLVLNANEWMKVCVENRL